MREVVAGEQERAGAGLCQRISEAIAEIQPGRMDALAIEKILAARRAFFGATDKISEMSLGFRHGDMHRLGLNRTILDHSIVQIKVVNAVRPY